MLEPLDHSKIPNMANVTPVFRDAAFDPGRRYSLPYMWGTIGIGYRKSRVAAVPDSWKHLYDSDEYSGRIAMLGDGSTIVGIGLKYLGYSYNETDPARIGEVEALVIRQKRHIKAFAEDNGQDLLIAGEVDLTMEWNGDILQVMAEDDDIGYVVPKEGGLLWEDTLAIPKGAPHPGNAHRFIDFILDAEVGAAIADFIYYATPTRRRSSTCRRSTSRIPRSSRRRRWSRSRRRTSTWVEDHQRLIDETWTRIQAA